MIQLTVITLDKLPPDIIAVPSDKLPDTDKLFIPASLLLQVTF